MACGNFNHVCANNFDDKHLKKKNVAVVTSAGRLFHCFIVLGTKIFWIQVLFSDFKVEGRLGVQVLGSFQRRALQFHINSLFTVTRHSDHYKQLQNLMSRYYVYCGTSKHNCNYSLICHSGDSCLEVSHGTKIIRYILKILLG